ncbi:hypothetical protein GCM10007901_23700 [Dyella acidisoli]|uniref:Uncharacterized protein n=1 Tax=Dyella acidisoli TaxID=1867834 RepID=A0ABQ5XP17_9GAMM|nr:hypothetical protein GCM10007901_23700 [Dyella acidisoli]
MVKINVYAPLIHQLQNRCNVFDMQAIKKQSDLYNFNFPNDREDARSQAHEPGCVINLAHGQQRS